MTGLFDVEADVGDVLREDSYIGHQSVDDVLAIEGEGGGSCDSHGC